MGNAFISNKSAKAGERFYPNLKGQVTYHTEVELKQLRAMAYDLIDAKLDRIDKVLTQSVLIDSDLVAGRFLAVIARQDSVGGWTVQFATNKDGSTKFKGVSTFTADTTANSYTLYLFLATSPIEALLVGHESDVSSSSSSTTSGDASLFDPGKHQLYRNYANNNSTTLDIGDGEPSGGLTIVGTNSNTSSSNGRFVTQTSGGSVNQRATFVTSQTLFRQDWGRPNGEWAIRFVNGPSGNAATNTRTWVGLTVDDISDEATSVPTKSYATFRYATDVDGTAFWRCASDNGSGTPEVTTTTVAVANNTLHKFRIRWINDGSYIKFYSDDVLVATHTAKLPAITSLLRWTATHKALAGEVKTLGIQWVNFWF